jgi:hypothetical protein
VALDQIAQPRACPGDGDGLGMVKRQG